MTTTVVFRPWRHEDRNDCLSIFDANCPAYFAPNERAEYASFLDAAPDGYEVCVAAERVVGAFGLCGDAGDGVSLNWIMIDPASHGLGIGSAIMQRVVSRGRASQSSSITIAASHKSAPFFERFGAIAVQSTRDGWGPGMHRVDMELLL